MQTTAVKLLKIFEGTPDEVTIRPRVDAHGVARCDLYCKFYNTHVPAGEPTARCMVTTAPTTGQVCICEPWARDLVQRHNKQNDKPWTRIAGL